MSEHYKVLKETIVAAEKIAGDEIRPAVTALGIATVSYCGSEPKVLDARFRTINLNSEYGTAAVMTCLQADPLQTGQRLLTGSDISTMLDLYGPVEKDGKTHHNIAALRKIRELPEGRPRILQGLSDAAKHTVEPIMVVINDLNDAPASTADAFLRLTMLSKCMIKPHDANVDGVFGLLENVVWTNAGPLDRAAYEDALFDTAMQSDRLLNGMTVTGGADRFPRLLDYVLPEGVRIADPNRVRLGAHLAPGTTVMHEGFCNFNAGTLGKAMIEGRISAGVVVGAHSDVGGGASMLGTLSGGNDVRVSLGEGCLLEANSGIGIPLGNGCRVAAGHYVKSTNRVRMSGDWNGNEIAIDAKAQGEPDDAHNVFVKAEKLSGISDAIFRRNDQDGVSEVVPRGNTTWGSLNDALHSN